MDELYILLLILRMLFIQWYAYVYIYTVIFAIVDKQYYGPVHFFKSGGREGHQSCTVAFEHVKWRDCKSEAFLS